MYKATSQNMQRMKGRDTSRRVKVYVPKTRAEQRKWWYPVIEHHYSTGTDIRDSYAKLFPTWLEREIQSFTTERWLAYWGRKRGRPARAKAKMAICNGEI